MTTPAPRADFSSLTGLVRLLYASRWSRPPGLVMREETRKIVIASIANNRARDVTGLLLIFDGYFVQALEGPAAGVQAVYERVLTDPRHSDVALLGLGPAPSRAFRDWNMTARELDAARLASMGHSTLDPYAMTGEQALDLLKAVGGAHVQP